jgi:hypothetical protein
MPREFTYTLTPDVFQSIWRQAHRRRSSRRPNRIWLAHMKAQRMA